MVRSTKLLLRVAAVAALAASLTGAASTAIASVDPVPVARWSMDEDTGNTAADGGATGSDLSFPDATWVADGHSGSALHFGGSSYAVANASALHVTDLTVTAWVRGDPAHPPVDGAAIVELGGRAACGHATWGLYVAGQSFAFGYTDATTGSYVQTGGFQVEDHLLWDGQWHLISVATTTAEYAYIDQAIDQFASGFSQASPHYDYTGVVLDHVVVGGPAGNCNVPPNFRGDVDDLRIYDAQLTGDQVGAQMDPVATTTTLTGTTDALADDALCYQATVAPTPGGGKLTLTITPEGGTPTTQDMLLEALGLGALCTPRPAGEYTAQATYQAMKPWLTSSSAPLDVHVGKRASTILIGGNIPQLTSQPFRISLAVDGGDTIPTGTIDLFEVVDGDRVAVGTYTLENHGGTLFGGANVDLPNRPPGTYDFEAEYAGDANHMPADVGTGEIVVTQDVVPEAVQINGGAAGTSNPTVSLSVGAIGARSVVVSMDGARWKVFDPYQAAVPSWSLVDSQYGGSDVDGVKTVHVRWYNAFNQMSEDSTASIVLDRTAPTALAPRGTVVVGSSLVGRAAAVQFAWSGSAAPSGMDHYRWSLQTDGGTWSTPATVSTGTLMRSLATGHTYRLRVQPVDKAGNTGTWASGSTVRLSGVSQSSSAAHWSAGWSTSTNAIWWGGTARSSFTKGSTMTYTFTGKSIAWVGLKATTRGKAQVYVNGVLKATVDLYSATTKKQVVVWSASYATSATRTITIKVLGTSGRPRVDVDGFLVGS